MMGLGAAAHHNYTAASNSTASQSLRASERGSAPTWRKIALMRWLTVLHSVDMAMAPMMAMWYSKVGIEDATEEY